MIDKVDNILLKSMDIILKRHEILANNIANIDTPGFIKKDIDFENEIKKVILNEIEFNNFQPDTKDLPNEDLKLEKEILQISKNTLLFNSAVKILLLKHKILESSLGQGGI